MATKTERVASRPQAPAHEMAGVVRLDEMYTLESFKRRMNISDSAWRAMSDEGFPHKIRGKRKYILGKDAIAYMDSLPNADAAP